jgi:tripartite-type tricarboxylate transporter receptor subunit TctC
MTSLKNTAMTKVALTTAAAAALALAPCVARADAVADFYKGKQISVYIGFTAGGGYDAYARLVSKHMGDHIPGKPVMIPKNMAGAGSRKATSYVYNVAPKDGTTLATADQSQALQQAMQDPSIQFDVRKLVWIGNPNKDVNTLAVWHTSGIKTLDDAKKREVVVGATGSNTSAQYPQAMNFFLGTKFKIINGYPGGNDINLAMERGEVMGRGSNAWASWKGTRPDWLREKKIIILVQIGLQKDKDLQDVPLMMDLGKTPEDRAALKLLSAATEIGRPLFSTPNVPADRVAALRKAFDKTMADPKFLADAKQAKLDLDPVPGTRLQEVVNEMLATPKPIVDRLATALEERDVVKELPKRGGGK